MFAETPRASGWQVCQCGRKHKLADTFSVGDRVRVRVHWRYYHRTGTVKAVRNGFGDETVYDVDLDANDAGSASIQAMLASELWRDSDLNLF